MRKIVSIFLVLMLILSFCSCSEEAKETASASSSGTISTPSANSSDSNASSSQISSSKPSSTEQNASEDSSSKQSSADRSSSKQSASKQSASKQSASKQSTQSPSTPKPSVNQSQSGQSAGSKAETVPYKVEFKNTVSGYITHYNAAGYTFKTDKAGFSSCDDFYVALPGGTSISCQKDFAFFCYDEDFLLNTEIMSDSGLTLNFNKPEIKPGNYTLSHDCYLRFSVKGNLSDIKIAIPKGREALISFGTKSEINLMPTIKLMQDNLKDRASAVNYIFITDLHYGNSSTTAQGAALIKQVETAVALANSSDAIDFICIGGDTTTGMYETKAEALKYTSEVLEPLKESKKPVFILMGNHDDNSYHRFTYDVYYPDRIISDKDWNDKILKAFCPSDIKHDSKYSNSKYFYYDLKGKKTRVICLDAVDYRAKFDNQGNITELPIKDASATTHVAKYWSGCSWWGYSDEQLNWLMTEAMTAGNDWNYVFLSHMGIDSQTNSYNYSVIGGSELRKIISSYQNKNSCRIGSTKVDFSKTKGQILAYQFGHQHIELTLKSSDIDLWQICTATASAGQKASTPIADTSITDKTLGWKLLDRVLGTESEACIDVMSADSKRVYKWNIGGGNDVAMDQ